MAQKYKIKIDFRPFIHVEGIDAKDFRKHRISILNHTAVIFTSRSAADHFFRICGEMRVSVPESMKYFCISESTAYYLQKYVQYRKRKIFHGKQTFLDLMEIIKKHRNEYYMLPCSDIHKDEISDFLDEQKIRYSKAVMFKTVTSNLKDIKDVNYDVVAFFSPTGVKSLLKNFPKFRQGQTRIAAFGPATAKAVEDAKLILNIYAPTPEAPSMTMALDQYVRAPEKAPSVLAWPKHAFPLKAEHRDHSAKKPVKAAKKKAAKK